MNIEELKERVEKASEALEAAREKRQDVQVKLNRKQAEVEAKRESIGRDVVDGQDVEELSTAIAHGQREAEALEGALREVSGQVASMEAAVNEAKHELAHAEFEQAEAQAVDLYLELEDVFTQVDEQAALVMSEYQAASDARSSSPYSTHIEHKHELGSRLRRVKELGAGLRRLVNEYRARAELLNNGS